MTQVVPHSRTRLITRQLRRFALLLVIASGVLPAAETQAATLPVCPTNGEFSNPPLANVDELPSVASWLDLGDLPANCHISLQGPAALTIALAGRFTHTGSADQIAARLGAVSRTQGLSYWSVTDEDWRTLVSEAFALDSIELDTVQPASNHPNSPRQDFTGQEMLSGRTLYFAQNDTRSWGLNTYSIRAIDSSADHLVFESDNISPIRLGPITLFQPGDVRSVLFLDKLDDTTWAYFSLAVIRHSSLAAREKSLINRQAAFYRFLVGQPADKVPPLAP